jgi:hypothetical protein
MWVENRTKRKGHKQAPGLRLIQQYWPQGIVVLIILFFACLRFRLRDMPLERDEGEYAYAGQLILQGIPPYKLAYNMKLPGTYVAYSLILGVFGETPAGIHWGLLLINAATTWLIYLLARRLFGSLAGVVAAASYALLSTSPSVLGFAGHATHFVVIAAVGGILLLLKAIETRRLLLFFGSGFLLGLAFLMKQPGIFFALFAGVYLAGIEKKNLVDWRGSLLRLVVLSAGVCLPFALTCVILLRAGVFREFWFWTFSYGLDYGSSRTLAEGMQTFLDSAPKVVASTFLLWILAGVGLLSPLWSRKAASGGFFLVTFSACSLLAVCPGLYFREHYFILILPAVSVLVGVAVSCASESLRRAHLNRALTVLPAFVFLFSCMYALLQQRAFLFELDPIAATRNLYGLNPFPEAIEVGRYLKSRMPKQATLAVLGSEPEIYFYSDRHSATGYIYSYGVVEEHKYAFTMQEQMIREVEAGSPEFLVYVSLPTSWLATPGSAEEAKFSAWADDYIREKYELDGVVDLLDDQTQYFWGEDAKRYTPRSPYTIRIFKRTISRASISNRPLGPRFTAGTAAQSKPPTPPEPVLQGCRLFRADYPFFSASPGRQLVTERKPVSSELRERLRTPLLLGQPTDLRTRIALRGKLRPPSHWSPFGSRRLELQAHADQSLVKSRMDYSFENPSRG